MLHVTDPHLFADPAESLRGTVTHDSLRSVLAHIRATRWPADLVALTGDLVQDDSAGAYQHVRRLFADLGLPVHCVPGNHDVRQLMRDALSSDPFRYCGAWTGKGWIVAGIDSCIEGHAGGHVPDEELWRLEALVTDADADHALVCLHHPPAVLGSRWLDSVGLDNRESVLGAMTATGKVRGCLFGHAHQQYDGSHGSLRILGTPSTCRQFLPCSDTFAVDDRPPAYRRVTLHADGRIESSLIWVESNGGHRDA